MAVAGRGCLVLGAAARPRAVAYALLAGGRVHLLSRRIQQAQQVAQGIAPHFPEEHVSYHTLRELPQLAAQWPAPLIINATPLGMAPEVHASPWPAELAFPPAAAVYDLVYNPARTLFLQQAWKRRGCQTINGLGMLLYHEAQALTLWTGQAA